MRALIVDDSVATRFIIRRILASLDINDVLEAENGKSALSVLEKSSEIDVALVDWNMPEMNGLELIKQMQLRAEFSQIPIIMVTTETEMTNVLLALESGAREYVMKPFNEDMISEKLRILGIVS